MTPRSRTALLAALALFAALALAPSAQAAAPRWSIDSIADTAVAPSGTLEYLIQDRNTGDAPTDGSQIDFLAELPPGLTAVSASLFDRATGTTHACFDAADGVSPVSGKSSVLCPNDEPVPAGTGQSFQVVNLKAQAAPSASGTLTAAFSVSGGGAANTAQTVDPTRVSVEPTPFGIDAFDSGFAAPGGGASTLAGAHPSANSVSIDFNTLSNPSPLYGIAWPAAPVRDVDVDLPPGLAGNPSGLARCTLPQLAHTAGGGFAAAPECPPASQVGTTLVRIKNLAQGLGGIDALSGIPVFNLVPPPGVAAQFGFNVVGSVILLDARVRSGSDYGISVISPHIPEALALIGSRTEFWGVPSDPSHDSERACPGEAAPAVGGPTAPAGCPGEYTPRPEPRAFFRNPTSCTEAGLPTSLHIDSWVSPGALTAGGLPDLADPSWRSRGLLSHEAPGYPLSPEPSVFPAGYSGPTEWGPTVGIEECAAEPFAPSFEAQPTTPEADSPTGLDVQIAMPQEGLTEETAISESDLKKAVVTLPAGISVNPAAASGQGACSASQIGLSTPIGQTPIHFTEAPQSCPDSSKIGSLELESPLLTEPERPEVDRVLHGAVYLAAQSDNPFGSLLAMYLVVEDEASGVTLKLPGEIVANEQTGQLETVFDEDPQLPFEALRLHLFGGPRAALKNPPSCGQYATQATLTGWSGKVAEEASGFTIDKGPNGGPCPSGGFDPGFSAGTQSPLAGQTSPFSLRVTRNDGEGLLGSLSLTTPPGFSGYLTGIPYCPDSTLAAISSAIGTGRSQIDSPSCPSASQVGTVTVGAGAGPNPFYTSSGRAYLAGPYKGAPISLAVVTPAVAGPFDLGNTVVRNALRIDPETAQITNVSDPLPTILHGIPLDLRDIRVDLNRPHFTLNPTSCEPMSVNATITSAQGASAHPSQRFQAADCNALPFKPALSLKLKGKTARTGFPALHAVYAPKPGGANLRSLVLRFPRSEFIEQGHFRTICTRVQFAASECPKASIYGHVRAYTPLLDKPLEGPVYLRSSSHKLPDVLFDLNGQIHLDVPIRIDSIKGGLRASLESSPDAPVSRVILDMQGGQKSLFVNSRDVCAHAYHAAVSLNAQNAKTAHLTPALGAKCAKGKRRGGHGPHRSQKK